MSRKKPESLEKVARKFADQLQQTAKTRDPSFEQRREKRDAEVSKALAAHQARRKVRPDL